MRITILFILVTSILTLAVWVWNVNPTRLEYLSLKSRDFQHEQVEKIRRSTDLNSLKEEAIGQLYNFDEQVINRERATVKVQNLLTLIILLTIIAVIILFLEIAARGKNYRQHNA